MNIMCLKWEYNIRLDEKIFVASSLLSLCGHLLWGNQLACWEDIWAALWSGPYNQEVGWGLLANNQ